MPQPRVGTEAPSEALPVLGGPQPERADAARNRAKILAAARRLFTERGVEQVSMDDVAAAAGVGKGTLFRRFGDRAGLALALLDESEREVQDGVVRGPPPLGPGAPAGERLRAFFSALLGLLEEHRELLLASESGRPTARFRTAVYAGWHQHTALLIGEARPDANAPLVAHLLLSTLSAGLFDHLRRESGADLQTLREALDDLLTRAVDDRASGGVRGTA